jgi:hypothetical protein
MAMAKFFVDLPTSDREYWSNVGTFDTKEEALKFVQENYGADQNGKVCLVSEISDDAFEETEHLSGSGAWLGDDE